MEESPLSLLIERGPGEGKTFDATQLKRVTIGRTQANDYPIKDPTVSRKQAVIEWRVDHWALVDVGSSNGTFVNRKVLVNDHPVRLQNGDLIRIGESTKIRVQIGTEEEEEENKIEVDGEEQGISVEKWFQQERLRLVQAVHSRGHATILELNQSTEQLKRKFRERDDVH